LPEFAVMYSQVSRIAGQLCSGTFHWMLYLVRDANCPRLLKQILNKLKPRKYPFVAGKLVLNHAELTSMPKTVFYFCPILIE
jgi:hypothetical protein